MRIRDFRVVVASFASSIAVASVGAAAQTPSTNSLGVVVHSALGGFILGYDIDPSGSEGVLAEAVTLANGNHDVAVETFDQATGNIVKIVRKQLNTKNDFVALGVVGTGIGLVEYEHVTTLFVDHRRYAEINPLSANAFTKLWTPPLTASDILDGVSHNQGSSMTAFLGFHNGGNNDEFLFTSNVGANSFGPKFTITNPDFAFSNGPKLAVDESANQAVLGASNGCPLCPPKFETIDLATGATTDFPGLGLGYINGIAIDSATRIACTSTEIDFSVEFYDLATQTGFLVKIPGATSQAQSGQDVELDPVNGLFFVGQEFSSTSVTGGSSIQIFDEQGHHVKAINGLSLPASPALIALNPTLRTGWVIVTPALNSIQSFSY